VLAELGHLQPPTAIHLDNTTTVGIVNNTIKQQIKDHGPWKCNIFGYWTVKHNTILNFTTSLAKKTLAIIHPSIKLPIYINTSDHITSA
jgi:hypothetical protein